MGKNIKMDLRETGLEGVYYIHLAQDTGDSGGQLWI